MKKRMVFVAGVVAASFLQAGFVAALEPSAEELGLRAKWTAAKFDGISPLSAQSTKGIWVHANNDPVQKNSRNGRPMKLGQVAYTDGLYCHAVSNLEVRLGEPAKRFTAVIGVDHNENTGNGGGSVEFVVVAHDKELYKSPVMHGGADGVPIAVDLGGAETFFLRVTDGGDGIASDQADWANPMVELASGEKIPLSSLDITQDSGERTFDAEFPFSFDYNGKSSREFLGDWKKSVEEKTEGTKCFRTLTFDDPTTRLQVRAEVIEYLDFPNVEWTLYFKNGGKTDTPILENIKPLDSEFTREFYPFGGVSWWDPDFGYVEMANRQHEFLLHHFCGAPTRIDDYLPLETSMGSGGSKTFTSNGRPMSHSLPYFNLQAHQQGWIIVVGWPGQWTANFQRDTARTVRVTAGQGKTHFSLLPGEEIRTPMVVIQPWARDSWLDAQNVWRAWMVKYNVPRQPDGSIVDHHMAACSSHFYAEMTQADSDSQKFFIDRYLEEGLKLDYWWMDAGWYPCDGEWPKTGTWEVDETRFPGGLRPITDHGRSKGVESIVWFEPERVHSGTWLTETHPEWILGGKKGGLLNLGHPDAWNWLTDHIDAMIKKEGIDLYRQDFNMDPLKNWQANDTENRQGITEIGHVTGYLAYWDALLARNPGLRIDSCASGGNRNDLETMRRSVPLLRSDYILEAVGNQNHTFGISLWIPYHGTGMRALDEYGVRSILVPFQNFCYDMRDRTNDYSVVLKNFKIWEEVIVPVHGADYYPLTTLSNREDTGQPMIDMNTIWCGWQYNDPATGKGAIQMFRRIDSPYSEGTFRLYGLDADAAYLVTDVDTDQSQTFSGRILMEKGLPIKIDEAPKAVILSYRKK